MRDGFQTPLRTSRKWSLRHDNSQKNLTFVGLVDSIKEVDVQLARQASKAVNISLTLRNWLIGMYIAEYEQNGKDRATYGDRLLERLSSTLLNHGVSRVEERELRRYRQFYQRYPQIRDSLTPELGRQLIGLLGADSHAKREPPTPGISVSGKELISKLSFTHIVEFLKCEDHLKRVFYEIECICGNWSVRELKRQIASLYYERSGLSKNKKKLADLVQSGVETIEPKLSVRDPYIFEFLGLKSKEVMSESSPEDQLLDKLREFLLELGHGFCFEARQKRIPIGSTQCFVDMVFYHRILKCHVLIELKIEEFNHEHIGQLNTYVSWFKKNAMTKGDNPPVGILLCTAKDHALVEYALAGMNNKLFVSKYQLELPKKEEMQKFIEDQMKEVQGLDCTSCP